MITERELRKSCMTVQSVVMLNSNNMCNAFMNENSNNNSNINMGNEDQHDEKEVLEQLEIVREENNARLCRVSETKCKVSVNLIKNKGSMLLFAINCNVFGPRHSIKID